MLLFEVKLLYLCQNHTFNSYLTFNVMYLRKNLSTILLAMLTVSVSAQKQAKEIQDEEKPSMVFLYSPGEKQGVRVAYGYGSSEGIDTKRPFVDVAQVFASDYSSWGSEKRMYSPYVYEIEEGGYAAVFQVNNIAPCFAVAYSEDLITWRPQDYPRMSQGGCFAPVIRREGADKYAVLFKNKDGKIRKSLTDSKFRHFTTDVAATEKEYNEANVCRDTLTVGDKTFIGNAFPYLFADRNVEKLKTYFDKINADNELWKENLGDDKKRFESIIKDGSVKATLNISSREKEISDKLIGIFFEDISYAADGGLYAELIQNRDFEYTPNDHGGWNATTAWRIGKNAEKESTSGKSGEIVIATDNPLSKNNPHYTILEHDTLYNMGWDGILVKEGAQYDFSFYVNNIDKKKKNFTIALVSKGDIIASATIKTTAKGKSWKQYTAVLTAEADAEDAQLMIIPEGKGRVAADMISLFPQDTFKGRKNGLRKDLAQVIADLQPKFVRFPGGCMSHGQGLDNIYHWNHTIGELYDRVPDKNIWNYHQTRGLGFYEFFQFCEDIGAEPLPVLAAGVPCQNSKPDKNGYGGQQGGIPMEDMPAYIQELLDLIEWANGDPVTSMWGKKRAEAGHPEPFNLKYIGIGNEDIISTAFEERCKMICEAIREKYPEIQICGTAGPFHAPSSDYIEGWKFANENRRLFDLIDEHYYESVGWFINNQHYYDNYDRTAPKVYLGEYAARSSRGLIDCALAEALHLSGIERNGDVVEMTSYAPMLCNDKHHNWDPDMIYFTNKRIDLTPSYETQRLFSKYCGNRYVESKITLDDIDEEDANKDVKNSKNDIAKRIAATVVRDTKTQKRYLKLTNVLPVNVELNVTASGLTLNGNLKYEGFSGQPGQKRVKIETGKTGEVKDGKLSLKLKPYSFQVIEL